MHLDKNNFPILSFLCDLHFKIHHGYGDKITLYRWLLPQKDLVVPYSLIIVGCGAIIIKDDAILLVQEKAVKR